MLFDIVFYGAFRGSRSIIRPHFNPGFVLIEMEYVFISFHMPHYAMKLRAIWNVHQHKPLKEVSQVKNAYSR